jgi:ABC-type oligopeptide transport system substrate-binding subunit
MATRHRFLGGLICPLLLVAGCRENESGPIAVSAIGGPPRLVNPNLKPLDPPSAYLVEAVAQGLVRFNAGGEIEPALAQRWIVSDDGLRYTFRLARAKWADGRPVTAQQAAARLRAAGAPASGNALKPILGAIEAIVAMTDEVLEISLKSPRPNFLQLLAQPEMAVIRNGQGSGPYRIAQQAGSWVQLAPPAPDEEAEPAAQTEAGPTIVLRGEKSALAVARFDRGLAELVTGGTLGDLPVARAAQPATDMLVFDPVSGLLGLAFAHKEGMFGDPQVRQALSMAVDRGAIMQALAVPGLQARESLLPPGGAELPRPAAPGWAANPLPMRRELAARTLAAAAEGEPLRVKVAMPEGPGYRLLFAYLRRDWAAVGVTAELARKGERADLRLVDAVAPVGLATWYLRHFTCEASPVCDPAADESLAAARTAPDAASRREQLANAERLLSDAAPFIPVSAPVRWSLVSPRLTGFRPNLFARHPAGELVRRAP